MTRIALIHALRHSMPPEFPGGIKLELALALFSMARARAACEAASGVPVLTTVASAVRSLRLRLA